MGLWQCQQRQAEQLRRLALRGLELECLRLLELGSLQLLAELFLEAGLPRVCDEAAPPVQRHMPPKPKHGEIHIEATVLIQNIKDQGLLQEP
jgi:hypothetical protein